MNINGYTLAATNDELHQFTIDVATSALDKDAVAGWLREHVAAS